MWSTRQSLEPSFQDKPNRSLAEKAEAHTININCSIPWVALREKMSEVRQEADIKDNHEKRSTESQSGSNT